MPMTRGRAREVEEREVDVDEEEAQPHQQQQQQQQEEEMEEAEAPAVELKEMLMQLTKTAKRLLASHRELEEDAAMIQAGMDELYRMQEVRSQHIVGRLQNASSTILTFADGSQDTHNERPAEAIDGDEEEVID